MFGFDLPVERQKILVCGEMDFSFARDLTAYMQVRTILYSIRRGASIILTNAHNVCQ